MQSRYYDAEVGRFINGDEAEVVMFGQKILPHNYFRYCKNNPIICIDPYGYMDFGIILESYGKSIFSIFCVLVVGSIILKFIFSKEFTNLWQDVTNRVLMNLSLTIALLGLPVYAAKSLKTMTKELAESIAISFAKVKTIPNYKSNKERHHIVARKSVKASLARKIINKVGIGCESPKNLVLIQTGLHRRLHRNLYFVWVNSVVEQAYSKAGNKKTKQRINVIIALGFIKKTILAIDKVSPF